MTDKILVTGASGKLGSRIIHFLLRAQAVAPTDLIAVTRDPSKLSDLAAKGVDLRKGDFNDPASLPAAFAGADRVLIVSTDALDPGGDGRLNQHKAAIAAAVKAGAKRLFYTSMPNPEPGSPILFANDHYGSEQAIKATGLPYTIFRNGWYQENLLMSLPTALQHGAWATSAGAGKVAYGARDDMAAAIAAGLANPAADNITYTLTGPAALGVAEIAEKTRQVTEKPLQVLDLSDEALTGILTGAGVPEGMAKVIVSFDTNTRAGRIDLVTGDIEKLTGRKPAPVDGFFNAYKDALLAGPQPAH